MQARYSRLGKLPVFDFSGGEVLLRDKVGRPCKPPIAVETVASVINIICATPPH